MTRPILLDLFCCAGGAAKGYHDAGFDVVGVDVKPMPRYPFEFVQADAVAVANDRDFVARFDAIHASPPCKVHTALKAFSGDQHTDLIPETRAALVASGKPYVIENVVGAPLINPLLLCGSMFGLRVRRHRLFESNVLLLGMNCDHKRQDLDAGDGFATKRYHSGNPVTHRSGIVGVFGGGQGLGAGEADLWREVMEMPWAVKKELAEAIPPAYTRFIGRQLLPFAEGAK